MLTLLVTRNTLVSLLLFYFILLAYVGKVHEIFLENKFDAVMHFAAVAYVGESTADPLK